MLPNFTCKHGYLSRDKFADLRRPKRTVGVIHNNLKEPIQGVRFDSFTCLCENRRRGVSYLPETCYEWLGHVEIFLMVPCGLCRGGFTADTTRHARGNDDSRDGCQQENTLSQVQLQNVSKIYPGNVPAVTEVDFTAHDSEFIVLLGPSGCGKSTILRLIAGLEHITAGKILIGERVVNKLPPKERDVAMVFQSHALYPQMNVYKNLSFSLKLRKHEPQRIDESVRRVADILGLRDLLDRKPGTLSGGEQQRVALGRAMVRQPAVFLFDEPLSNLAAHLRLELRVEIKRMHRRLRTTTIYVTHDQEEAMTLADRMVVMSAGRIQQCGTPIDIYHSPANRFVAGFLGAPVMNVIDGRLERVDGVLFFNGHGLRIPVNRQHTDFLADAIGQKVVLGLRPEGVVLNPGEESPAGKSDMECRVDMVEPLGGSMNVFLHANDACPLVARVEARPVTSGSNVKVWLNPNSMHFFSPGPYGENLAFTHGRKSMPLELPSVASSDRASES